MSKVDYSSKFDFSEEEIIQRLAWASGMPPDPEQLAAEQYFERVKGPARPAAVLIPFVCIHGEWHILFTRRTDKLVEHSGQVAFPGGRMDPQDPALEATALREAREEIGLPSERVRILGRLARFVTNSNYAITPVVGAVDWPFEVQLEAEEVSRVFTIPLAWLADPANHEVRERILPPPLSRTGPVIYFNLYDGELLWGVSAQIMVNLLKVLT